jgi:hypothetical protein
METEHKEGKTNGGTLNNFNVYLALRDDVRPTDSEWEGTGFF